MNTPNILYYAKMVNTTKEGGKTPKFTIVEQAGYYPPMERLRGRDGRVSMYLMEKLKEGDNVPSMRLQAKGSLNFTGLKEFFEDGKLSGFAYGYPYSEETYSKDKKPNPFYKYREDGFLFRIYQDEGNPTSQTPICIEMIVLESAKVLISSYCKLMKIGGYDDALAKMSETAKNNFVL